MTTPPADITRADDDSVTVQFERRLPHPVDRVWEAITDPAQVAVWFSEACIEPGPHGTVAFDFGPQGSAAGRITEWQPPTVLEHTWSEDGHDSMVRWELRDLDGSTLLVLTHRRLDAGGAADYAAGWQVFIDRLAVHLDGGDVHAIPDRYHTLRDEYATQLRA